MNKTTLLMKTFRIAIYFIVLLSSTQFFSQTNRVTISVNWADKSYQNKVEVYDPANNLLLSICNLEECYVENGDDVNKKFNATYDLGCLPIETAALPNYYVKLYDAHDDGWNNGASFITINVAGVDVFTDDGSTANLAGVTFPFSVNSATYCNYPDTDGDLVIDLLDIDDDNDGVLDAEEGLGIDNYSCALPTLIFQDGAYESGGVSGDGDDVGSIYRFGNALEGYDILVEIVDMDHAVLKQMDDDSQDTPEFLQTEIEFDSDGPGTPGIEFKFTLVDEGTSTPSASIFRIGGTTWDVDGTDNEQESVRYYNPSAYGTDNPTSLTTETFADGIAVKSGNVTYNGFATNTILRSYFQFLSNTFNIRMQLYSNGDKKTRQYAMSFTQCDILDYKAPQLVIVSGTDTDGDGIPNQLDLDSDNDGIPDNIEAQTTTGYVAPNGIVDIITGVDTAYPYGLVLQDTDGDNTFDLMDFDSDNDGTLDIDENGMDYTDFGTDTDNDGLDDVFEGILVDDQYDVNDDIDNPSVSVLPDSDNDLDLGGDLDYRDGIDVFYNSASLDFDGEDDYIDSELDLGGMTKATFMAWVKLDSDFSETAYVVNQDKFYIKIDGQDKTLEVQVNDGKIVAPNSGSDDDDDDDGDDGADANGGLKLNQWYHIAVFFDSTLSSDNLKLFLNGKLFGISSDNSLTEPMETTNEKFTLGKESGQDDKYFKGAIDEVRVFDIVLTTDQFHQMIHQEIKNNYGFIMGVVVPKNIVDLNTNESIPWTNLQVYYPMTTIFSSRTTDYSFYNRVAKLYNITTLQEQTAPMPYTTSTDGNWDEMNTWSNGDVWDISSNPETNPWSIIKVSHNMTASNSIKSSALIIDADKTLTVTGDNEVSNSWYLELNGTIDLQDDSQLVQGEKSDLVTSNEGKILRRQEGNANKYWYNYWSSPVGGLAATTLSDNNGVTNNESNTAFSLNILKDGSGNDIQFTSAYDAVGKVSTYWLYTFQNGTTYYDWNSINQNSAIQPGFGYTQKGTGVSTDGEQQYIFEGKPNNGTILVAANDNNESGTNTTTTSLIGNPYPSALNAIEFINDNKPVTGTGVISGTILLWEQWAGNSHYMSSYQGGYGYINTMTTERAYQHADIPIANQSQDQGIKTPTFNIPVGQGFFVEVISDGNIEFNNGQRVFVKETDADGTSTNGSTFFRSSNSETTTNSQGNETSSAYQLIRFEFGTSQGSTRRFVVGFGEDATEGYDYGLDGGVVTDLPADDMGSLLNGQQYVIQALSPITADKVVDLNLNASGNYTYSLKIVGLENIPDDQDIYLRDNQTNTYFNLKSTQAYEFTSVAGQFTDRFDIVFQSGDTLSNDEFTNDNTLIYVNNLEHKLFVKNLTNQAKQLSVTNMLGQAIKTITNVSNQNLENGINISNLNSGVYIVSIQTDDNQSIDKKIIVN